MAIPFCVVCRLPIFGRYLVDPWGTAVCARHERDSGQCDTCGRFFARAAHAPAAALCASCSRTVVERLPDAVRLFGEVSRWLGGRGLSITGGRLRLELADGAALDGSHGGTHAGRVLGTTRARLTTMGAITRVEVDGIVIARGLPASLFRGVAAHELGHAWLGFHQVKGAPAWQEEGFCEVLAHLVHRADATAEGRHHATRIEQNRDPIYGEGFRRVAVRVAELGLVRFLERTRLERRVP